MDSWVYQGRHWDIHLTNHDTESKREVASRHYKLSVGKAENVYFKEVDLQ
jgi:hypothetical protein